MEKRETPILYSWTCRRHRISVLYNLECLLDVDNTLEPDKKRGEYIDNSVDVTGSFKIDNDVNLNLKKSCNVTDNGYHRHIILRVLAYVSDIVYLIIVYHVSYLSSYRVCHVYHIAYSQSRTISIFV